MLNGKMRVLCRQLHKARKHFNIRYYLCSGKGSDRMNKSIGIFLRDQEGWTDGCNFLVDLEHAGNDKVIIKNYNIYEGELELCNKIAAELKRVLGDKWVFLPAP